MGRKPHLQASSNHFYKTCKRPPDHFTDLHFLLPFCFSPSLCSSPLRTRITNIMKFLQGQLLSYTVLACALAPQALAVAAPKPDSFESSARRNVFRNIWARQSDTDSSSVDPDPTATCDGQVTVYQTALVTPTDCPGELYLL